jgi:hypothetical protein
LTFIILRIRKRTFDIFIENLSTFYANTIETLVFTRENEPDTLLIVSVLKVATKGIILGEMGCSLMLKPIYKRLIIQILFKNYHDMVLREFDTIFRADNSSELALILLDSVQDQCFSNDSNKNVNSQVEYASRTCSDLINKAHWYENLFSADKTYQTSHIVFVARLKYCIKVLARITQSSEAVMSVNAALFEEYLAKMRQLIEPTLEDYKNDLIFNFLIKEIIRKYSNSSIKFIMSEDKLKWIVPKDLVGENLVN